MTRAPRTDGVAVARRLVAQHYPQARAAWLGGSVAAGTATESSDLDITVLLSGSPAPFRRSETRDGWPVEWFVQTEDSLLNFCDDDRTRRRRPTTMRLVGSAIVLVDADGSGQRLQQRLHAMDQQGPPPAPADEVESQRYAVTDLLSDLTAAHNTDECLTIAATLLREAGDLLLAVNRRWSGSGKWLLRELNSLDEHLATTYAAQLMHGLRAAAANDPTPIHQTVLDILEEAGGPLFTGFHRGSKYAAATETPLQIRSADVDEPGNAELLALAIGGNERRLDAVVQRYRDDPAAALLVATLDQQPVGVLGYRATSTEVTLLHIATAPDERRGRVGSRLLAALRRTAAAKLPIVAETDNDAVAFYTANNFTVKSLGEKYPGVERFHAKLEPPSD